MTFNNKKFNPKNHCTFEHKCVFKTATTANIICNVCKDKKQNQRYNILWRN